MTLPQNLCFLLSSCLLWSLGLTCIITENQRVDIWLLKSSTALLVIAGPIMSTLHGHKQYLCCLFSPPLQAYPDLIEGKNSHMLPSLSWCWLAHEEGQDEPSRIACCLHTKSQRRSRGFLMLDVISWYSWILCTPKGQGRCCYFGANQLLYTLTNTGASRTCFPFPPECKRKIPNFLDKVASSQKVCA